MATNPISFYLTKDDPDFSIKGARDPLGFQVIWQHQGKEIIPHLSTVSTSLQDFQILCLAYSLYGKEPDNKFVGFFLMFEQLMGYVRFQYDKKGGFNGVEKIKKKISEGNRISISLSDTDSILSNQRTYGIWGKYNRPFQDIGFRIDPSFDELFQAKISSAKESDSIRHFIGRLLENKQLRCDINELECFHELLKMGVKERRFFQKKILEVPDELAPQNVLFGYLEKNEQPDNFDLFPFLKGFKNYLGSNQEALQNLLIDIQQTEYLLCPLNRIFRYLQTRPIWAKKEIVKDKYIHQCIKPVNYVFHGYGEEVHLKNKLIQTLSKEPWDIIEDITTRNAEVAGWREGAAWISINKDVLEVHHMDGSYQQPDYNPIRDFDNGYFINSYISLYRQIMRN